MADRGAGRLSEFGLFTEGAGDDVPLGIDHETHPTGRGSCALQNLAYCIRHQGHREYKLQLPIALYGGPDGHHAFAGEGTTWPNSADCWLSRFQNLFEVLSVGGGAHPISERTADIKHLISAGIDELNRLPKRTCFVDTRRFAIERVKVRLVECCGSRDGFGDLELEADLGGKPVDDAIERLHGGSLRAPALLLRVQENDPTRKKRKRHRCRDEDEDQGAAGCAPGD
ncbi:hypothetical protein ACVW0J_010194 [Bradyrhizobium sp. i1.7.7]